MLKRVIFTLVFISASVTCWASAQDDFHQGIELYRQKKWDDAKAKFQQAVQAEPRSSASLYNLGLTEMQLGEKGEALAHFRMALYWDAALAPALSALEALQKKVDRPFQARELSTFEAIRQSLLLPRSINLYLTLTAILLALSGWLLLRFLSQKKRADDNGDVPPPFPVAATIVSALTVVAITLAVAKVVDAGTTRVTVISKQASLKTGPGEEAVSLLEVPEGNELIVENVHKDNDKTWLQVTLPGSFTGWMSDKNVSLSSGLAKW